MVEYEKRDHMRDLLRKRAEVEGEIEKVTKQYRQELRELDAAIGAIERVRIGAKPLSQAVSKAEGNGPFSNLQSLRDAILIFLSQRPDRRFKASEIASELIGLGFPVKGEIRNLHSSITKYGQRLANNQDSIKADHNPNPKAKTRRERSGVWRFWYENK